MVYLLLFVSKDLHRKIFEVLEFVVTKLLGDRLFSGTVKSHQASLESETPIISTSRVSKASPVMAGGATTRRGW